MIIILVMVWSLQNEHSKVIFFLIGEEFEETLKGEVESEVGLAYS